MASLSCEGGLSEMVQGDDKDAGETRHQVSDQPDNIGHRLSRAWDAVREPRVWAAVVVVLGLSLWAQLFLQQLVTELSLAAGRPLATLAYMTPPVVLVAALALRRPVLLLAAFPLSCLPGLALLPEQERLLFYAPWAIVRVAATLVLYTAVASAGSERPPADLAPAVLESDEPPPDLSLQLRYVHTRLVVVVLMLLVPAQAIFASPEIDAHLVKHYGPDQVEIVRTFLGLFHFFVWCVAAYMMVLVPSINMEYDQRKLSRAIDALADRVQTKRVAVAIAIYVGLGVVLALVGVAL